MSSSYEALLSLLLPGFILENFELKSSRKEADVLHIDLEEINSVPTVLEKDKLESKGFFPTITVQDFPIRGHQVYFHIKRRRWLNHSTGKVAYRDWTLVAEGTRMTVEFTAFLKQISQYKSQ
ncbi:transposase [Pedobacter sp. PAMC26386]|nr:transposase [Pedobacter sp. PAMC26386]